MYLLSMTQLFQMGRDFDRGGQTVFVCVWGELSGFGWCVPFIERGLQVIWFYCGPTLLAFPQGEKGYRSCLSGPRKDSTPSLPRCRRQGDYGILPQLEGSYRGGFKKPWTSRYWTCMSRDLGRSDKWAGDTACVELKGEAWGPGLACCAGTARHRMVRRTDPFRPRAPHLWSLAMHS